MIKTLNEITFYDEDNNFWIIQECSDGLYDVNIFKPDTDEFEGERVFCELGVTKKRLNTIFKRFNITNEFLIKNGFDVMKIDNKKKNL